MKNFKKVAALTLFLSLIASFVLYKADVFTFKKPKESSEFIVSNFITKQDSLEKDRRLLIDYTFHLDINRSNLTVEKRLVKTFTLETWDTQLISSSKSFQVHKNWEIPQYASKNDSIVKKLKEHRVKRVRFTMNRVFDGKANDSDLFEVIQFVENKTLKSNSSLELHINEQDIVNLYWEKFNESQVEINDFNNSNVFLVDRKKVNKFLKWYNKFEAEEEKERKKRLAIMFSSKSGPVEIKDITKTKESTAYLEKKKLFKQKLKEYLDIEL